MIEITATEDDFDETCGDCVEGRCHFGGADPLPGEECGCERHDASVKARELDGERS